MVSILVDDAIGNDEGIGACLCDLIISSVGDIDWKCILCYYRPFDPEN